MTTPLQTLRDEIERLKELEKAATPIGEECPERIYLFRKDGKGSIAEMRMQHNSGTDVWRDEGHNYHFYYNARSALPRALAVIEVLMETAVYYSVNRRTIPMPLGNGQTFMTEGLGGGPHRAQDAINKAAEIMKGMG